MWNVMLRKYVHSARFFPNNAYDWTVIIYTWQKQTVVYDCCRILQSVFICGPWLCPFIQDIAKARMKRKKIRKLKPDILRKYGNIKIFQYLKKWSREALHRYSKCIVREQCVLWRYFQRMPCCIMNIFKFKEAKMASMNNILSKELQENF